MFQDFAIALPFGDSLPSSPHLSASSSITQVLVQMSQRGLPCTVSQQPLQGTVSLDPLLSLEHFSRATLILSVVLSHSLPAPHPVECELLRAGSLHCALLGQPPPGQCPVDACEPLKCSSPLGSRMSRLAQETLVQLLVSDCSIPPTCSLSFQAVLSPEKPEKRQSLKCASGGKSSILKPAFPFCHNPSSP